MSARRAPEPELDIAQYQLAQNTTNLSVGQLQIPAQSTSQKLQSTNANIIGAHYKIGRKIGEGSFGVIYEGLNLLNNQSIAIKFEPRKSDAPQLRDEYRTYKIMASCIGVPAVYYYGQEGLHNILVIDLLGPSLEDMFDLCNRKFSVKTVCMLAKQMITRVQSIHERNLIYRDIKPDNFLVGRIPRTSDPASALIPGRDPVSIIANHSISHPHPASQIYIVDFGMAKLFRDPKTKTHIPYREKKSLSEQSRRDDLEALGHVFMYFLRGSLPWQGLKAASNKQKYEKIGEKKQTSDEFVTYLSYARNLKFEEQPDYEALRTLMNRVLTRLGEIDDGVFDWMIILDQKRKQKEMVREAERVTRENEKAKLNNGSNLKVKSPTGSAGDIFSNSSHIPSRPTIQDTNESTTPIHSPATHEFPTSQDRPILDIPKNDTPPKRKWWQRMFGMCGGRKRQR